jgi:hypothetical protein
MQIKVNEKMKKVLFLTLFFLIILETVSIKAQVRIGGNSSPNATAVLDLNADDSATPEGNKGALALPRVRLTSEEMKLDGANTPVSGMLVYHTGSELNGPGVYVWLTNKWVKASTNSTAYKGSTSVILDGDSLMRAALTGDVTAPQNSNATTIANNAVSRLKLAGASVLAESVIVSDGYGFEDLNPQNFYARFPSLIVVRDTIVIPYDLPGMVRTVRQCPDGYQRTSLDIGDYDIGGVAFHWPALRTVMPAGSLILDLWTVDGYSAKMLPCPREPNCWVETRLTCLR